MMQISSLFIYPVKSLKGIPLESAEMLSTGFKFDRKWMLVDPSGKFITQRECPSLAQIRCSIQGDQLVFQFGEASFQIGTEEFLLTQIECKIWRKEVLANLVSAAADKQLSAWTEREVQLVRMPDNTTRSKSMPHPPYKESLNFPDSYSYLIISQASLDNLNTKLETPVPMDRFRPNIVLRGLKAHEEDNLDRFDLQGRTFRIIKPCVRCGMITIDQETTEVGIEPLETLRSYRRFDRKILFGAYATCTNPSGILAVE